MKSETVRQTPPCNPVTKPTLRQTHNDANESRKLNFALLKTETISLENPQLEETHTDHASGQSLEKLLHSSVYSQVRRIKARCERNVVVLQGQVSSFFQRQIALSITMKHLPGVFIVDFIEVIASEPTDRGGD